MAHPTTEDGMDRLLADVMTEDGDVPPDRDLRAMVNRIIEIADFPPGTTPPEMALRLGIVQGTAERLRVALG